MINEYMVEEGENFKCPECNGHVIKDGFQYICKECGLVISEEMRNSNYKVYENMQYIYKEASQYVSIGKTVENVGMLGSYIDYYEKKSNFTDINGNYISYEMQALFSRLKNKYSKFIKIKNKETEYRIMNILSDVVKVLGLSQAIRKDAAYYYKKIKENNNKIRNNISLIAFCILYAVRNNYHNAPITLNEIAKVFQDLGHRINPRLIIRNGILYKKLLKISEPHKSEDYLNRLVDTIINNKLVVNRIKRKNNAWRIDEYKVILYTESLALLKKINTFVRGGRNPFNFAGAAIYSADKVIAKKYNKKSILTQKIVSEATGIPEYSIRDHYVKVFKRYIY